MAENSKYRFFRKLIKKYRLVILNDRTFEEKIVIKISPLLILITALGIGFLVVLSSFVIIKNFKKSESNTSKQETQDIISVSSQLDSLIILLETQGLYVDNLKRILNGNIAVDSSLDAKKLDFLEKDISLEKTKNDELFRIKMEKKSHGDYMSSLYGNAIHFFPPLIGTFTETYDVSQNHLGIDIVSIEGSIIKSVADGVVVINNWTQETGFIIGIQHSEGFLSFYKHNSKILKDIGDYIKSGDGIAIIGNSGELSSGPHLHFELWKNGYSVNPENYIAF